MIDDVACLQCGSRRAQISRALERTLGGRPARYPAPGVILGKFAGERLFVQLTDIIVPFGYAQQGVPIIDAFLYLGDIEPAVVIRELT